MALGLESRRMRVHRPTDLIADVLQLLGLLQRLEVLVQVRYIRPTHGFNCLSRRQIDFFGLSEMQKHAPLTPASDTSLAGVRNACF
ncbi:Uncharacterised protein [Mycobacteroides abscessus subsp. abscessus]|nr:Uncharacterised protein [Mycobacteroides abscessus subsp. abscessus]